MAAQAPRGRSGVEDIMDVERLVLGRKPFGTCRRPSLATLVERQLQGLHQRRDFLPRRHMNTARRSAEAVLVEMVERREAAREEFTIDCALSKAISAAKAEPR